MISTSLVPSLLHPMNVRVTSGKSYATVKLVAQDESQDFTLHVQNESTALVLAAILSTDPRFEREADRDNLYEAPDA